MDLERKDWRQSMASALTEPESLLETGEFSAADLEWLRQVSSLFSTRIPWKHSRLSKPLKKQFLPQEKELLFLPEELDDPIADSPYSPVPGIVHRYPDRALLMITAVCGVYCRYCFRREKVSQGKNNLSEAQLRQAFEYLKAHSEIEEVILTGGDPLVLSDQKLKKVLEQLHQIPSVRVIRFHTRMPTIIPSRVTEELLKILSDQKKQIWLALHINHQEELTPTACDAIRKLQKRGVALVSQTVLLKEINDSVSILSELFKALVQIGVKPYYLHYPDLAKGTSHFRISLEKAISLVKELRGKISGLCLPSLMVDIPGGHGKIVVEPQRARQISSTQWEFESPLSGEKISVDYPPV